jgi:hypothetical protein
MNVQGTEVSRKIALFLGRDGLVAEEKHLMFDHEFAETVDDGARQLSREIDPVHDGADNAVQTCNFDCHVRILGSLFAESIVRLRCALANSAGANSAQSALGNHAHSRKRGGHGIIQG